MKRYSTYLKYVMRHKKYVAQGCKLMGVPKRISLLHDWDKFLPDMFIAYARSFYKPDGSKQYKPGMEFNRTWMRHQHINKHHWQAWLRFDGIPLPKTNVIVWDHGGAQIIYKDGSMGDINPDRITADPMDDLYVLEMVADWYGAGMALGKPDIFGWYKANMHKMVIHEDTRIKIDQCMRILVVKMRQQGIIETD